MSAAPRLMLLGACGQVGQALRQTPLPFGWELGLYGHKDMDIARPAALREAVQRFRPDLIMNAAAFTKIDEAEQAPDKAIAVNFEAVAHLAAQCSALDIPLIHLSTDHVFDGRDETPYPPDFPMNPLNIYGQSKMMGEEAIRHELAWHVILRTSWVFSSFGNNVLTRLLQKIDSGAELIESPNYLFGPTPASALAHALFKIAAAVLRGQSGGFGTFHFCGQPACTRFAFAEAAAAAYAPFLRNRPQVTPLVDEDFSVEALRPRFSVLDCRTTQTVYGLEQPAWSEELLAAVQHYGKERSSRS